MDQFEALFADSRKQPRVMGIPLHPMISGQPLRIKYLQRAIAAHEEARGRLVCDRQRDHRRLSSSGETRFGKAGAVLISPRASASHDGLRTDAIGWFDQ